ncbi:MAG: polymerase delta subunit [Chthoniobacteraceae bacterium]|nr:polymerase delta subunit [Chthoniobacteraceae bacterium]
MAAAKPKPVQNAAFHAVLGSDESEVKRAARELAGQLSPGGDFGVDIIDGSADNADQAATRIHQTIEALLTFPFFGGEKLVWLKNATFLADNPTGRAAAVVEALEKLVETISTGIPASTRFLLSAIDVDKRRSFYKTLPKLAKVTVFDKVDTGKAGWEEDAAQMARRSAEDRNLRFDAEALELFALFTGGDRRVLQNEIEKLDLYLGLARREISVEDVRLLVPLSRVGIIFELGNAIAERNLRRSLSLLEQLLFQGETAVGILLVAIIPTVRNLLVVKDLMTRHKLSRPAQPFFFGKTLDRLPPDATAHLPRKKDGTVNAFALGLAAAHAHRYRGEELRAAFAACLAANVQMVTSSLEAKTVLSQLVVRIVAA